ncbi:ligase-associated DNA damage response endonuclease PdeM [Membranihabitans maritimus]|uniref:ligase-associated DNA damage response endonuclease PdeM n=1 Tax=Membranihabitans maritimus TaxID=2904244 RepID=UPI001F2B4D31
MGLKKEEIIIGIGDLKNSETFLKCKSVEIILFPEKCVLLSQDNILIVADLHLGKAHHFNRNGIMVPTGTDETTLKRLESLLQILRPQKLVFLGDLFHSELNSSWQLFHHWLDKASQFTGQIMLVKGNHDILDESVFANLGIPVVIEMRIGRFLLTHEPAHNDLFNIYGHLHPGIKIRGKGKQKLRLPCFGYGGSGLVLPAFGEFTGLHILSPASYSKFFAIADGLIFEFGDN